MEGRGDGVGGDGVFPMGTGRSKGQGEVLFKRQGNSCTKKYIFVRIINIDKKGICFGQTSYKYIYISGNILIS